MLELLLLLGILALLTLAWWPRCKSRYERHVTRTLRNGQPWWQDNDPY